MFGSNLTTSWTDTNAPSFSNRFYRVVRGNPNTLNNGIPYGWAVSYGLDPLDPNLATNDVDASGYSNWDDFLMGISPTNTNGLTTVYVDRMNTNGVWDGSQADPFRYIQDAIECSVVVTSNLAIRVRPGNYYETVSNQHYDFYGDVLSKRQFVYLYAANSDWSLSADPETHIIDSSGSPNGDMLGNPSASAAPAVEFFDVTQARINGFTIRGGQGYVISAGGFFGGGILAYSSTNGPVYISNCIIEKNGGGATAGGGIFIQAGTNSLIYNTVIAKNTGAAGGILDVYGSQIWNCTVVSNVNLETDVGAVSGDLGMSDVRNCAIWGNGLDLTFADVDYSTFGSNEFSTIGGHTLSVDPILVNVLNGNYRLQTNTTVRGAGTVPPLEPSDLYGNPRPAKGSFDIGANQYTDSLGSGMQDDWEMKNGLSLSVNQGALDLDGDGLSNLQEYSNNTNPNDPDTDGDGISDGPLVPTGSGLQPGPDPNPVTPYQVITAEFHDSQRQAVWQYYVNGATDPSWINQPPTQPRWLKLNQYQIGDQFNIQMQYLSGPATDSMFFLVPLQSHGAFSLLPSPDDTPLLQFTQGAPLGQLTPPAPGWKVTVWQASPTNSNVCQGYDDESLQFPVYGQTTPALSVPQSGSNTFTVPINPGSVTTQVIFQVANTNLASVTPPTASTASQLVSVVGLVITNAITSTTLNIEGVGAQNSATVLASQVAIDILPKATNVTVAIWAITATGEPSTSPTNAPTQASLSNYLNQVYGQQANVFMNVLPLVSTNVNYDLNTNGVLDVATSFNNQISAEQAAITNVAFRSGAFNIYYVSSMSNVLGIAYQPLSNAFIQDFHAGVSSVNITAHEIGHLFGLPDVGGSGQLPGSPDRLMGGAVGDPCRLIRFEWETVNRAARGASQ
jgi:hypothetical protein